ncbi:MAG: thymidine kinase [Spirochaetia bacterium]|nr:thymidine kinase [Spirochaetia bacterium]MCF7940240.1 thymidine kinase [Spirochaetia bacterium]
MHSADQSLNTNSFLKSLGFPSVEIHQTFTHFDFTKPSRRVLVIGPMGSGKTEFSARVWRDAAVALSKSDKIMALTATDGVDRRKVMFVRSLHDTRFGEYPEDALAYRGGFVRCGSNIVRITDSFDLEQAIAAHLDVGTWIIDEASFYDERLAYVVRNHSVSRGLLFIFPTLILNFRRDIFNSTARLMLDTATDVVPLTAYCEHDECLEDSFYTYRYYTVEGRECPALYFDPLIIVGGDTNHDDPLQPNYCTRCDSHHYLPAKEYTFFTLKPLGEQASGGDSLPLKQELYHMKHEIASSQLYRFMQQRYTRDTPDDLVCLNALLASCIAEKALIYLYAEQNLITEELLIALVEELDLDRDYMKKTLQDNRRPVNLDQPLLKGLY